MEQLRQGNILFAIQKMESYNVRLFNLFIFGKTRMENGMLQKLLLMTTKCKCAGSQNKYLYFLTHTSQISIIIFLTL
jgi:hypothetical protein